MLACIYRRLQSCVGTRAKLGHAAFDAKLRKCILSLQCMLYGRLCAHKHAYAIQGVFGSGSRDMSIHMNRNNPGLQAPMLACNVVCSKFSPFICYSKPFLMCCMVPSYKSSTIFEQFFVCLFFHLSLCERQWEGQVSQTPGALQERSQPNFETSGRHQHCSGHTSVSVW